jgi:YegS/Rv2252/BmrU family lipid kinase
MAEKVAVILNPSAGRGKALRKQHKVEACLAAKGINYDLFETRNEAHLVETTVKVIPDYKVIVGGGGDTTINLIAHEILRWNKGNILGVLSLGSTNDLARELGVRKLEHACNAILAGTTRTMDVGRIHSGKRDEAYTFLAQASLGLGVAVNRYVADWMGKHTLASRFHSPAQMTAGISGVYNSFKTRIIPMTLELETSNNTRTIDAPLLTFNNTSYFAARFKPSPWASPVDGKLDCCIFNSTTFAHFLRTALQVNSQKHLIDNKVEVVQDRHFKIHASEPFEFQVDGEVIQSDGDIEVSVIHKALEVLINPVACVDILRENTSLN